MMKYLFTLSIVIMFTTAPTRLNAQSDVLVTHYSVSEGLANNAISDIIQDSRGFMWIATWNGLSRFDGFDFVTYKTGSDSKVPLLHNRVRYIFEDRLGNIWMSMYDEKLYRLNNKTQNFENATHNLPESDNIRISSSLVAKNGDIWCVAENRGVVHIKSDSVSFNLTTQLYPLPQKINQIYEDSRSGIWVATSMGAYRMDSQGGLGTLLLEGHNLMGVAQMEDKIYFGSQAGELFEYDMQSRATLQIGRSLGAPILSMTASPQEGAIYVGLKGAGAVRYSVANGAVRKVVNLQLDATRIYIDSEGLVWIFTNQQGVSKYDPKTGLYKHFTQTILIPEYYHQAGEIMERSGVVWVQMNRGGFGYYDRSKDSFEYFHNDPNTPDSYSNIVASFWVDQSNVVWLTTHTRGLDKFTPLDKKVERIKPYNSAAQRYGSELRALCFDADSCLWIADKLGVLYRYDSQMRQVEQISHDDLGNPLGLIYTIVQESMGGLLIGTKGNGMFRISPNTDSPRSGKRYKFQHYLHNPADSMSLSSNNIYSILIDSQKRTWIGTYNGGVNLMIEEGGQTKFLSARNSLKGYPIANCNKVRTLGEDREGNIWAGTTEGLVVMSYDAQKRDVVSSVSRRNSERKESLSSNDIIYIYRDRAQNMWLATIGGGLVKYLGRDKQGEPLFRAYTTQDGLPSNEVMSIVEDNDGIIWFATERNICSFDPERGIFSTLSKQEGVDDIMLSESAAITLPDGNVLFGSLDGYYRIDKERLSDTEDFGFKLQMTDFQLNDESVYNKKEESIIRSLHGEGAVTIPDRHMVFSFRYASLNYTIQGRVQYQYMLEGYDKEWINDGGGRKATYADIPRGKYTFRVKSFLLERPDAYEEVSVEVIVPPFVWETTGMLIVYGLVIGAGAMFIWWRFFRRKTMLKNLRVLKIGPSEIAFRDDRDFKFVSHLLAWLEQNYSDSDLKVEDMASISSMSRTSFYNRLKELTQLSPIEFITDFRLKKAKMYIKDRSLTITEIAYKVGFNDSVYFARVFKSKFGFSPSEYRKKLIVEATKAD